VAKTTIPVAKSSALEEITQPRDSFMRRLRAENRSDSTQVTYSVAIDQFGAYLAEQGLPTAVVSITREHVESFLIHLQRKGLRPAVAQRFRSVQQFFRFLDEEGEVAESPMRKMKPPHVPDEPPPVITPDEVKRLFRAVEDRNSRNVATRPSSPAA
jgi:site-specific recombinase XerD